MKRRNFLKAVAVGGLASQISSFSKKIHSEENLSSFRPLPKRPLGKTGEYLSIIGFGGILLWYIDQKRANQVVKDSIEAGVNYFDVAPTYGDAESKLGPALEPYRKNVFLACKSTKRTAEEVKEEMESSFKNLKTDYFDLYQLHALTTPDDIKTAFGKGGALEAIVKAREEGIIRFIGFSSHSVESAMAALKYFEFDTVLFPVNFVTWYNSNFGPQVIEYARSRGAAVLAIKAMASHRWNKGEKRTFHTWYKPLSKEEDALLGLRFTLSQPVTAAVPPGDETLYRIALKLAPSFIPLSEKEELSLKQKAQNVKPIFEYPSNEFNLVKSEI